MTARKDFSQVALDVVRKATRQEQPEPTPAPKKTAPKATTGAAKKMAKRPR